MKGEATRSNILNVALRMARLEGLGALSIGRLAKGVGLSKSGLFAHFNSKETLQLKVLERGVQEFLNEVIYVAIRRPRGEPRLWAFFDGWRAWAAGGSEGGCLFLGAAIEYDDQPGALRDYLVATQRQWTQTLARAAQIAQAEGHLRADVNPEQFAFEMYSTMMAYHLYHRLLGDPLADARAQSAFERLLAGSR
jgi:AcrR family transcriptional regulator